MLITGNLILSLSGDAGIRIWDTPNPTATNTPLLVAGQAITNNVDGVNFVSYPSLTSMLYVEAIDSGTATLTYTYVGTGSADGYGCSTDLGITAVEINFPTNIHYSCLSCPEVHTISLSANSYSPNGVIWSISPVLSGGASVANVASDYLSAVITPGDIRTNYTLIAENSALNECQDCMELIVGAYEWKDVGTAYGQTDVGIINYNEHLSPQYPSPNVYKIESGQNMTFRVTIADRDLRRQMCSVCSNSWSARLDSSDNYRIEFSNSGFGSFDPTSQNVFTLGIEGKDSANVNFYMNSNFVWTAGSTQTVSAVLYDCNTNFVMYPDTGSNVDGAVTVTWRFTRADYAPHHLSLAHGGTSWSWTGMYIYNVHPDPNNMPPGSQPYFESYILGESFTYVDPEFTMSDVASSWLYDPNYPERSLFYTTTDVARNLWPGPGGSNNDGNGTFTVNVNDQITDFNSAHVYTEPFTAMALTNGVGFSCEQSFTFGVNVIGTCDLLFKRFATNDVTTVLKSIPY